MADSFLDSAGGWTPVPDKLVREYGFEAAYVWGRIHRYCQMANGACTASHQTIADRAKMSRRTVIKYLDKLIEDGYIEDKTPDLKNKPHTYCTRIGEDKITSTMQISHTESDTPAETNKDAASGTDVDMRILHSDDADNAQSNISTMQNLHTEDAKITQPTMQKLHLKKDSLETLKETKTKEYSPQQKIMFLVLAKLCRIDLGVASPKQKGQIDQASKALSKAVTDLDQFREKFPKYWGKVDWRGKQGQPPTPPQIQEVYGDYCHWLENGEPAPLQKASQNGTHQRSKQPTPDHRPDFEKRAGHNYTPEEWAKLSRGESLERP